MSTKLLRQWRKVFQADLPYIVYELKELTKIPALVILKGDLGAGKTTFVQTFVGDEDVLSPSYSILSENKNVLHGDFYRIKSSDEIIGLEINQYLDQKDYFFAEWGEKYLRRIHQELPEEYSVYVLEIDILSQNETPDLLARNFSLFEWIDD